MIWSGVGWVGGGGMQNTTDRKDCLKGRRNMYKTTRNQTLEIFPVYCALGNQIDKFSGMNQEYRWRTREDKRGVREREMGRWCVSERERERMDEACVCVCVYVCVKSVI
jgi:hypothetical protein